MRKWQKFASAHASVHNHFPTDRDINKLTRAAALAEWRGPSAD
jgi:putative transposase